jgi:hypothetical protein
MLIDEPAVVRASLDPILLLIGGLSDGPVIPRTIIRGVYEVSHFGSSDFLRGFYEHYPELSKGDEPYIGCYGVCDDITNLLDACPLLVDSSRQFIVTLKRVRRDLSNKGRGGGWRWHKWGAYIGKQTPTTEYLDDEPIIEEVFCYHVFEKL